MSDEATEGRRDGRGLKGAMLRPEGRSMCWGDEETGRSKMYGRDSPEGAPECRPIGHGS